MTTARLLTVRLPVTLALVAAVIAVGEFVVPAGSVRPYQDAAESLAHSSLPGLVVASLVGLPLLLGAVGGLAAGAILVALAARQATVGRDTAVAIAVSSMLGLGALFTGNAGTYYASLETVPAALAGVVVYTYPVMVAVLVSPAVCMS